MQSLDRSDRQSRDVLDLGGHGFVLPRFARKPVRFVRRLVDGGVSMRPRSAVAMALAALVAGGGWWLAESGRAAPVLAQATAFAGLRIASVDVSGNDDDSDEGKKAPVKRGRPPHEVQAQPRCQGLKTFECIFCL